MKILAIETSCDETSASVVENGKNVRSNVISSQIDLHTKTGGIVPEVAAREQVKAIEPVLNEALNTAGVTLKEIDLIAVTRGPGLIGSLLVGVNAGKTLAYLFEKPIVGVNHLDGHIYSNWLEREPEELPFPVIVLVVSGGHNELLLMHDHGAYELLGRTLDDAAGEAFDKTARLIGLPYPGGISIQNESTGGNVGTYNFPRAWLQPTTHGKKPKQITDFNFSFSGLKTAVWQEIGERKLSKKELKNIAASIQEAICEPLVEKTVAAAQKYGATRILIAGGVSANLRLRALMEERSSLPVFYPAKLSYCTDNAAMIGAAAYYTQKTNMNTDWKRLETDPNLGIKYAKETP